MNIFLVVLLVVVGVLLLLLELFLLPGFGIAGVTGMGCLVGSVVIAYAYIGVVAGHIVLAAVLLTTILSIYAFLKGKALQKISLKTTIDSKVDLATPGKKIEDLEREAKVLDREAEKRRIKEEDK